MPNWPGRKPNVNDKYHMLKLNQRVPVRGAPPWQRLELAPSVARETFTNARIQRTWVYVPRLRALKCFHKRLRGPRRIVRAAVKLGLV